MVQAGKIYRRCNGSSVCASKRLELISLPHLPYIKTKDQRLYETLVSIHNALVLLGQQAGLATSGKITPPQIQSISVAAANGIFSVSLTDNSQNHLGINYFVEYADNANFNNSRT